ncbi:MAG: TOBE domain-containing protein [Opitutales bacterium]|jgi:molybdopterin-binding protein
MKVSARNVLKGTIKEIRTGMINTEVVLVVEGGSEIVSIITKDASEALALKVGGMAYAVIKASNVMIAVE